MNVYFIANNLNFTLGLIGAVVFLVMSWLSIDAFITTRYAHSLIRAIGFFCISIWYAISAFSFGGDLVNFIGFSGYLLGLLLIIISFLSTPRIAAMSAIVLIPSFTGTKPSLYTIALLLLISTVYLIFRQARREYNVSLQPLYIGFLFLLFSAASNVFFLNQGPENTIWYVARVFEGIGFFSFAFWVWQYLRLRIKESLILIFISMTLFIATIVTLAFSTILITNIEKETRNNLIINTRVFDFSVQALTNESLAEAKLISSDSVIANSVEKSNMSGLETVLTSYLEKEKLGFLLVTDKSGIVLMRAHAPREYGDSIVTERAVEEALIGNSFATIESSPREKFSIRAGSPLYVKGKIVGTVITGFPLDNTIVDRMKKITGLDTTVYQSDTIYATTTLSVDGSNRLVGNTLTDNKIRDSVLINGSIATSRVTIAGTPFLASYLPIYNGDKQIVGMFSATQPQQDIVETANATNRLTLITVTALLLLLAIPLYLLTKKLLGSMV